MRPYTSLRRSPAAYVLSCRTRYSLPCSERMGVSIGPPEPGLWHDAQGGILRLGSPSSTRRTMAGGDSARVAGSALRFGSAAEYAGISASGASVRGVWLSRIGG